ncbi:MAG: transferrin-binding protein-like solute binding protein [Roseinatronobacter sp.]
MRKVFPLTALVAAPFFISACGGGKSGAPLPPARAFTPTISQNGAGALETSTVHVARHGIDQVMFTFRDGPLRDAVVICADHAAGACTVVGGPAGTTATAQLEGRMAGAHAYAASLRLQQDTDGVLAPSFHRMYQALPGTPDGARPVLPQGVATYSGEFMAGAGVGGQSGIAEGAMTLTVNFASARLSGVMSGSLRDQGTAVSGSFNNVVLNPSGQFASDNSTTFQFENALAGGSVQGGFYGPTAQEAAGNFQLGNASGGMSGIFLTCRSTTAPCVSHGAQ